MISRLKALFELSKLPVSLLAACSTATGCLLASNRVSLNLLLPVLGIFLLACGASALNQVQERKTDALMKRTKGRSLPSGRISPYRALIFSLALMVAGSAVLFSSSKRALALGLLAVLWYNGVYTLLKRRTPFAVLPGSLVGAIPPAAGWVAGGGGLGDPRMVALSMFFFIWQVPHFGILLLKHGKEYEQAGLPSLTSLFEPSQLARIFFIWILAAGVTGIGLPLLGVARSPLFSFSLVLASLWLAWCAFRLVRQRNFLPELAFRGINFYALFVMILLPLGKFIG